MAIRFGYVPDDVARAIDAGLAELARTGAFAGRWEVLLEPGLEISSPWPVYSATAQQLLGGSGVAAAHLAGYRSLIVRHGEPVALVEATRQDGGAFAVSMINDGPRVAATLELLQDGAALDDDGESELRWLVLPETGDSFLWHAGASHRFLTGGGAHTNEEELVSRAVAIHRSAGVPLATPRAPLPSVLRTMPLGGGAAVALGVQPQTKVLNFLIQNQQQTKWCWAAVTASVYQYYTGNITTWQQCTVVNTLKGLNSCCENGSTPACNVTGQTSAALQRAGCLQSSQGVATQAQIEAAINANQVVGIRITWNANNAGHALTMYGYTQTGGPNDVIYLADPAASKGYSAMNFNDFGGSYGSGATWKGTLFTKHP